MHLGLDKPLNDRHIKGRPLVLVTGCNKQIGDHPFHVAGKKYVDAVRLAGCVPLIVPNADAIELEALLAIADGVFLTGSVSNVHPSNFREEVLDPSLPLDLARDAWTLPLVRHALHVGLPLFGVCRGTQETNVALGGSLHQALHQVDGKQDHRSDDDDPVDVQYGPAHEVFVAPGGVLAGLLGVEKFMVNSLHGQAVNRLAEGLRAEAVSPDGVVEAFSAFNARGFNLCVQWHPEWKAASNEISMRLLATFGEACRQWKEGLRGPHP